MQAVGRRVSAKLAPLDITQCVWADEKMFCIDTVNDETRLWVESGVPRRMAGEAVYVEQIDGSKGKVMVASGVAVNAGTGLGVVFRPHFCAKGCKINGAVYREMLECYYRVEMDVANKTVLIQDGAPSHTAKLTVDKLDAEFPGWLQQAPVSPDLNLLDYAVWKQWSDLVCLRAPKNEAQLRVAILSAWTDLDLDEVGRAVLSADRGFLARCKKCIEAGGKHFEHSLVRRGH